MGIKKKHVPGCRCCGEKCCAGELPAEIDVTIAGVTNNDCTAGTCADLNNTYSLPYWKTETAGTQTGCFYADSFVLDDYGAACPDSVYFLLTIAYDSATGEWQILLKAQLIVTNFPEKNGIEEWFVGELASAPDCAFSDYELPFFASEWYGKINPCTWSSSTATLNAA